MSRSISEIIRQIAKQEGISEQEVIDEMQKVIDAGYNNPDPAIQSEWASMPFKEKPTPQELIIYLAGQIRNTGLH